MREDCRAAVPNNWREDGRRLQTHCCCCCCCCRQILKRINAVITSRIAQGEALPPPPRTAIAGPEYFGLNDAATIAAIEALDPQRLCSTYWLGKQQR